MKAHLIRIRNLDNSQGNTKELVLLIMNKDNLQHNMQRWLHIHGKSCI